VQYGAPVRQDGGEGPTDPASTGDQQLQGRDQGSPGEAGDTESRKNLDVKRYFNLNNDYLILQYIICTSGGGG
jgi:hypothetical protein